MKIYEEHWPKDFLPFFLNGCIALIIEFTENRTNEHQISKNRTIHLRLNVVRVY